jgi:hypothetical protein
MAKKALLILIGGRQIPNLLTVQALQPDIIVPVASQDANKVWEQIKPVLEQLCPQGLQEQVIVRAFDIESTRTACMTSIKKFPDAEWIFNLTCATKIMSFGAYQVAQENSISAWYLDTDSRSVVTLFGEPPKQDIFSLKVADYMAVYGRQSQLNDFSPTQEQITFSQMLAQHPQEAMAFRKILEHSGVKQHAEYIQMQGLTSIHKVFCQEAERVGILAKVRFPTSESAEGQLIDTSFWKFIDGDWLEIYTWSAAQDAGCFDDYHYGVKLPMKHPGEIAKNEIDLAAISAASLLIAECKTEDRKFGKQVPHLDQLRAIASMLGGSFVGTLFISSKISPTDNRGEQSSFESFCSQAKERSIVVVTGEKLQELSAILKKEVIRPTYQRG